MFSFEHLSGLGILAGWTIPTWGALEKHNLAKIDIIGITFHPWLHYASPEQADAGHVAELISRIGSLPVAVVETGWPAENVSNLNPPWITSEHAQVDFISRFDQILNRLNVHIANWRYLFPPAESEPHSESWKRFSSVSLYTPQSMKRSAYSRWTAK